MKVHVYQSDSKGNCYHVSFDNGSSLFFEAGVSPSKITEQKTNAICLVSHSHADHSKYTKKLMIEYGARVVCSQETAEALGVDSLGFVEAVTYDELKPAMALAYVKMAEQKQKAFYVIALKNTHDCIGACAFIVFAGREIMFLCLDTGAIPDTHRFIFDAILIEANYTPKRLAENLLKDDTSGYVSGRVSSGVGHLSLQQVYDWVQPNLKYKPFILLGHRSRVNFDEAEYEEMDEEFKKYSVLVEPNRTYVCDALQGV